MVTISPTWGLTAAEHRASAFRVGASAHGGCAYDDVALTVRGTAEVLVPAISAALSAGAADRAGVRPVGERGGAEGPGEATGVVEVES